jgi:hypothetical protein
MFTLGIGSGLPRRMSGVSRGGVARVSIGECVSPTTTEAAMFLTKGPRDGHLARCSQWPRPCQSAAGHGVCSFNTIST